MEHDLRRLAEGVVERRVTGPDGLDGAWTALELAHGCTTRLSAPGSELLTDTIDRAMLLSPRLQPMRDRLAEAGSPWRFGTDRPEDELFLPRDWSAEVSLYSDVGTRLGRWPGPAHPRGTAGAPQSHLIRA